VRRGALILLLGLAAAPASAATVAVCADGCAHDTLQAAHDAAAPGDTIALSGRVTGSLRVLKPLAFVGDAGAVLDCRAARPAEGKACLVPRADPGIVIANLTIRGADVGSDDVGACVRGGDQAASELVIERLTCRDSHNGLMGPFRRLAIADSSIRPAGGPGGFLVHPLYAYAHGDVGDCQVVSRDTDWIANASGGSAVSQKCRASDFAGGTISAWEAASVDIRSGDGRHRFADLTITKPADAWSQELVSFGRTDGCGAGGGRLELVGITWPAYPPDSPWYWPFPLRWTIVSDADCGTEIVADERPPRWVSVPDNFRVDPSLR
jgi:hypothetical protein